MTSEFPVFGPTDYYTFPSPSLATDEGIVGCGGNLSPGMLISAYRQGIFPWFADDQPLLWWSPDPRFVLRPEKFHMSGSLRKYLKKRPFRFTLDAVFPDVIRACRSVPRPEQDGTWITEDMIHAYCALHALDVAHSVEVWQEDTLVGGLYGVAVGSIFAGESMFRHADNASKAVLAFELARRGAPILDCQLHTDHMEAVGGEPMSRRGFLEILKRALPCNSLAGMWSEPDAFGRLFYPSVFD